MTTPIEASRAALDQYTAALDATRVQYLAAVAEASGVPVDELPTHANRLPIYIGVLDGFNEAQESFLGEFQVRHSMSFDVPESAPGRTGWYSSEFAGEWQWLRNHVGDGDTPVFAFFLDPVFIAPFLDKLAALMTPPAPVWEPLGQIGDLSPNQVWELVKRGEVWAERCYSITRIGAGWEVKHRDQPPHQFEGFISAYQYWARHYALTARVELLPWPTNPA